MPKIMSEVLNSYGLGFFKHYEEEEILSVSNSFGEAEVELFLQKLKKPEFSFQCDERYLKNQLVHLATEVLFFKIIDFDLFVEKFTVDLVELTLPKEYIKAFFFFFSLKNDGSLMFMTSSVETEQFTQSLGKTKNDVRKDLIPFFELTHLFNTKQTEKNADKTISEMIEGMDDYFEGICSENFAEELFQAALLEFNLNKEDLLSCVLKNK